MGPDLVLLLPTFRAPDCLQMAQFLIELRNWICSEVNGSKVLGVDDYIRWSILLDYSERVQLLQTSWNGLH